MAFEADEGAPQRFSNATNNPKHCLPLKSISMTTMPWTPFSVYGIHHGGPVFCCGITKKGEPRKNYIKVEDIKIGHQKLETLPREPFDLSTLQSKLCVLPETSSARDGTGSGRPTKLACSGMEQPSATRLEYHMALGLPLHQSWYCRASVRHFQPPGDALHQTTPTGHLTGSDKIRQCACQPLLSQCSHLLHLCLPQCCRQIMFHGAFRQTNPPSCPRQLISGLVSSA